MAEFMNRPKPEPLVSGEDDGFNAFGKPVPDFRKQAAFQHCKAMGLNTEESWNVINPMCEQIRRDEPYAAMEAGTLYLDVTGTYRIMAVLCSHPEAVTN